MCRTFGKNSLVRERIQLSNTAGSTARRRLDRFRELLSRGGGVLTSIGIAGEATYPAAGEKLTNLKKINYLFGHNGCGKTTVSWLRNAPHMARRSG